MRFYFSKDYTCALLNSTSHPTNHYKKLLGIVKKFEPQNTSSTFFLKCIQEYIEIRIASFIHEYSENHRDEIDHIDKIIPILSANDLEGKNGASFTMRSLYNV